MQNKSQDGSIIGRRQIGDGTKKSEISILARGRKD
jgi:hypothetical protein